LKIGGNCLTEVLSSPFVDCARAIEKWPICVRRRAPLHDLSCAPNGKVLLEDPNDAGVYSALNLKSFGRDLFDGVPKPKELRFTLRGWGAAHAVHVVQCYTADLAFDDFRRASSS
jgi:hypothetical protein